jgi:hypothetical protein
MFPQSSLTPGQQAPLTRKLLPMRVYVTPSILLSEIPPN